MRIRRHLLSTLLAVSLGAVALPVAAQPKGPPPGAKHDDRPPKDGEKRPPRDGERRPPKDGEKSRAENDGSKEKPAKGDDAARKKRHEKLEEKQKERSKTRQKRRKEERQEAEKKYPKAKDDPAARAELAKHAKRMARLRRSRELAVADGRDDLVKRVDAMITKEQARHQAAMRRHQGGSK